MKNKVKDVPPPPVVGFSATPTCCLPVWDDKQVAAEDWGATLTANPALGSGQSAVSATLASLGVPVGAAATVKESGRAAKTGNKETAAAHASANATGPSSAAGGAVPGFVDPEGRAAVQAFVEAAYGPSSPSGSATNVAAQKEPGAAVGAHAQAAPQDGQQTSSPSSKKAPAPDTAAASHAVTWQRPLEIVKPFRPVVHRNPTPFLNPYVAQEPLLPFDAKLEEARYRVDATSASVSAAAGGAGGGGSTAAGSGRSGRQGGSKDVGSATGLGTGPWHQLYPETVSLLEDLVGQDASAWVGLRGSEAVARYRELPALLGPYTPELVAGCAETPAEACRSRYSTALRHKLQQAEALAALETIPPFLMGPFNSALLVVEQAQHLVPGGHYLWELIYPHAPGTCHPVYNPHGKYAVKLYIDGAYRKVLVDDALPVDPLGRPLLCVTARKELWPAILVKALLKALRPMSHTCMTTDPDTIVSCLMGNWVPQYVKPRRAPVATATLLVTYQRQLAARHKREAEAKALRGAAAGNAFSSPPSTPPPTQAEGESSAEAAPSQGMTRTSDAGKPSAVSEASETRRRSSRAGSAKGRVRSASTQRKPKTKEVAEVKDTTERLYAEENCPPSDDEPIDMQPMLLCGLRTVPPGVATRARTSVVTDKATAKERTKGGASCGIGTSTQLYAIADVVDFRNTLAVRIVTTPKLDIAQGVFERERDAKDVQEVLARAIVSTTTHTSLATTEKLSTLSSVWLTVEELTDALDGLVVWHNFDGRYLRQTVLDTTNTRATQLGGPTTHTGPFVIAATAAGLGAGAATTTGNHSGRSHGNTTKDGGGAAGQTAAEEENAAAVAAAAATRAIRVVAWVSLTSDSPEEVAVVISSPSLPDVPSDMENHQQGSVSGGEVNSSAAAPGGSNAGGGGKNSKGAKPGGKGAKKKEEPKSAVASTTNGDHGGVNVDDDKGLIGGLAGLGAESAAAGSPISFPTPLHGGPRTPAKEQHGNEFSESTAIMKQIHFEAFHWQRAEPLSNAFCAAYANGKTTSHRFQLRPGTHIYKVTIPEMYSNDRITFHSNTRMTIRGDLMELLKAEKEAGGSTLFHLISDAGAHPAVEAAGEEVVWFKRRIAVTTETKTTLCLSALLPDEDASEHRFAAPSTQAFPWLVAGAAAAGGKGASGPGAKGGNGKTGAGSVGAASGNTAVASSGVASTTPGKAGTFDRRACSLSILKYTCLLLVDLDKFNEPPANPATVEDATEAASPSATANANSGTAVGDLAPRAATMRIHPPILGVSEGAESGHGSPALSTDAALANAQETHATAALPAAPSFYTGYGGRLPMVTLRPNKRGYLVMAYTSVPSSEVDSVKAAFSRPPTAPSAVTHRNAQDSIDVPAARDGALPPAPSLNEDTNPSPPESVVYGRGQWALTIRSGHGLAQYEPVQAHQQVVPIVGSLRRGGASVTTLFRYSITIAEPTHLSLLLTVRESVPLPFDVTIKRVLPGQVRRRASSYGTAAGTTTASNATPTVQDTVALHRDSASNGGAAAEVQEEVVLTITGFRAHAFMPDVLLAPGASTQTLGVGGKGERPSPANGSGAGASAAAAGGALFVVEASVPPAAAAEWDELCRQTQAQAYAEKKAQAMAAVRAKQAADAAELAADKDAFIAKKTEELELQEARDGFFSPGAEGLVGNPREPSTAPSVIGGGGGGGGLGASGTSRNRRSVDKKKSFNAAAAARRSSRSSAQMEAGLSNEVAGSSFTGMSVTATSSTAFHYDSTPEELSVNFHGTFFLSSAKAEVKDAMPAEDPVAEMRSLWQNFPFDWSTAASEERREAVGLGALTPGSLLASTASTAGAAGAKAAKALLAAAQQQQQQREAEEQLRGARGKRSRQAFLSNPLNVLEAHFSLPSPPENAVSSSGREGVTSSRGRAGNAGVAGGGGVGSNTAGGGSARDTGSGSSSARREHSKGGTAADGANNGISSRVLVYDDSERTNFSHAAPLSPKRYSVKLLPLRAVEVVLPTAVVDGAADGLVANDQSSPSSQQGQGTRASSSSAERAGKAGDRDAVHSSAGKRGGQGASATSSAAARDKEHRHGGSGTANASSSNGGAAAAGAAAAAAMNPTAAFLDSLQAEAARRSREAFWTVVQEPLATFAAGVAEVCKEERASLQASREQGRKLMLAFADEQAEAKRLRATPAVVAADGGAPSAAAP